MGKIHCCSALRRSKSFELLPSEDFLFATLDIVEKCPQCGHFVLQLTRIDYKNNISIIRKNNKKARKLYLKLKPFIKPYKTIALPPNLGNKSSLKYSEFGKIKTCYSNLSTMRLGTFENKNLKTTKRYTLLKLFEIHKSIKNQKKSLK